jgi:hypothetical protein
VGHAHGLCVCVCKRERECVRVCVCVVIEIWDARGVLNTRTHTLLRRKVNGSSWSWKPRERANVLLVCRLSGTCVCESECVYIYTIIEREGVLNLHIIAHTLYTFTHSYTYTPTHTHVRHTRYTPTHTHTHATHCVPTGLARRSWFATTLASHWTLCMCVCVCVVRYGECALMRVE